MIRASLNAIVPPIARSCACGCGKPTLIAQIEVLAWAGQTRKQIASILGKTPEHVKTLIREVRTGRYAGRWIKGHQWREPLRLRVAALERSVTVRGCKTRRRFLGVQPRQRLLADQLRAFDMRALLPFTLAEKVDMRRVASGVVLLTAHSMSEVSKERRRTEAILDRLANPRGREGTREQIDWLRNRVGEGWRQDGEWKVELSLEGMLAQYGSIDWLMLNVKREEQERLDEEYEAARAVMESPPLRRLVSLALSNPNNLLPNERDALRLHYEMARDGERLPRVHRLQIPGIPGLDERFVVKPSLGPPVRLPGHGGGGWKRGRGSGRRSFAGIVGTKRFEGSEQIAAERALRTARQARPS